QFLIGISISGHISSGYIKISIFCIVIIINCTVELVYACNILLSKTTMKCLVVQTILKNKIIDFGYLYNCLWDNKAFLHRRRFIR
ncbi:hypothetical protein L9F63_007048, partial [Diploptera punctata]